jgi:serine/threonine protein phosphatase 1
MIYVMSDIHGQYDKYRKMLELIGFSGKDELYVLGDAVDRGPDPVKLLWDMSMRPNVLPIMGNHEYMAEIILKRLNVEITKENCEEQITADILRAIEAWREDGGETTLKQFRRLTPENRGYILEYFEEFTPYEELEVGGRKFLLVHGGLPDFSPEKPLEDYKLYGLITDRPDYSKQYFTDRYLVTGHTPTVLIDESYAGKIYRKNGHIAIDCGAGWGGRLGCIRLDDMKEFYVD